MLQLCGSLLQRPVLSLRTGGTIAMTSEAIINPNNLKIEGFYCTDARDRKHTVVLLYQDIRDIIPEGFVVNDFDSLTESSELVRLKDILDLRFQLVGKPVISADKEKLGKVNDYATEINTMFVQKLYVSQSVFKNPTGGQLGIDRTQIVEITPRQIIVQDVRQRVPAHAGALA